MNLSTEKQETHSKSLNSNGIKGKINKKHINNLEWIFVSPNH